MKKILFVLCCIFCLNASADCTNRTDYKIEIKTRPAKYITTLTRQEFLRRAKQKVNPNTLGLTTVSFKISAEGEPYSKSNGIASMCVGLQKFILTIGYDDLTIYIDKKYKRSSCEYRVVKEHEEYHASVAREALVFFKPDIEKRLKKIVAELKPEIVHSQQQGNDVIVRQTEFVLNKMQPLINHINKKIAEKNYQIDTPESYRKTTALCKNW